MMTSNFKTAGRHPSAVAICRGVPSWYRGKRYLSLSPTREMLANLPDFDVEYDKILAGLNPRKVYKELVALCDGEEPILLCWELFDVRCHRRRVAEWLMAELDVEIPELNHHLSESTPYFRMPRKGKKRNAIPWPIPDLM
jgi:hypothetical protein